ncbi:MAG: sulfite exporter TauE/SafE family protein [Desulfovibrio sp.]|nr:sulfite exporter TauE/SafE family protein [Desulfovibrio sp.]
MTRASALVFVAWLLGGFISGCVGIGGAMLAVPMAALLLSMHEVILISCILNVAMDLGMVLLHWRYCRVKALWAMWLGAVPGSFLGLSVLLYVPDHVLRIIVGMSLLCFIYWQRFFSVQKRREHAGVGCLAGFVAGILGSAISFDGPPVGAYALYAGWQPREVLGTLGIFFTVRGLLTVFLQWQAGLYTDIVFTCSAFGIPAAFLGTFLSYPVIKRMRLSVFARLLPLVLTIGAVVCLAEGLISFWRA